MQSSNDITGVCNLSQQPTEVIRGELSKQTASIKGPATGPSSTSGWIEPSKCEPHDGAGYEVEEVLTHVDEDVVGVEGDADDGIIVPRHEIHNRGELVRV